MMNRGLRGFVLISLLTFSSLCGSAQTFNGQGGLLVPPGAPGQTVGITTSTCTVSGVGILGTGCSFLDYLTLDFTHTWVGDCALFIIAPSGEIVELSSSNGSSGDNFQVTVFTDNTPLFITSGTPPYNGSFRPEGRQTSTVPPFPNTNPLGTYTFANTFTGIDADGDWTLLINDFVALDVGVLNSWSLTFSVGGGPAPTVNLGPDITICPGQPTTLVANVTPAADSYLWNTGATSSSITVSPASSTFYSVTVTNNDCIDIDTIQVVVNPGGVTANAGLDISICQGNSTTLTGSGGSAGATYNWSTGQSGQSVSVTPTSTTTYTLTVTDGSCFDTDQVVVTVTPIPNADAGPPVSICTGQSTTLVATGGTQNNHYLWSTGQTGSSINVSPINTTTYTVTVTVNGCSDTDDVLVTVNPQPTVDAGPGVQICAGESTDLSASGSGGTYLWSTGQTGAIITVSPLTTTTYTVTVTANGCTATDNVTVTVGNITAGVNPNQSICEGTIVILTATGGTSYEWSTGESGSSISVSPTSTTTYTVTATQGSCTDEASVVITVNPVPTASVTPDEEICAGVTVSLTASGGNTYSWSSGQSSSTINVTPLSTTNYTVTVTSNGCSSSASVVVSVNPSPNASAGTDESICAGESVTLTASGLVGPGEYLWSTGDTDPTIDVQPAVTTTYTVTITNEWDCFDSDAVTVTVNPIPIANAGPDIDLCSGTGTTLMASGGTTPNTYSWSTGQSGSSINVSPIANTTYTVTVTVNGCSSIDETDVTVLPSPLANAGPDQESCAGVSVELSASGGGTYLWSNGQSTQTIDVMPSNTTTYTITVTNGNGCTDSENVTVTINQNPQADAGPDQSICDGESATLVGTGGVDYQWSTGATTPDINVSPSGTTSYSLTVTDMNGCIDTDVVTVVVNATPFANAGPNVFILNGETAVLTASGGGTYLWNTGETTNQIMVSPGATTVYSVTVTVNGCSDVDDVTVFVNEAPTVDLGPDLVICEGETATLDASVAGPFDIDYEWSTGETTSIINVSPSMTTSYSVTATDMISGLSSMDTMTVTVLTLPLGTPVINGTNELCEGDVSSYTVDPVIGAITYTWSVPMNASIFSGQGTTSIEVDWGTSTGGQVQLIVANDCGALPASFIDVVISTPPAAPASINGQLDPCAEGTGVYSVSPVADADSYQWDVTGGAIITAGQGTLSVTISWNGTTGGDVSVIVVNECGNSVVVAVPVVTTATPSIDAGVDQIVCGLNTALNATGQGSWMVLSGPGTSQLTDINNPFSSLQVSVHGSYTLQYSFNQNNCFAEDFVDIVFKDNPVIINESTDCNDTNTEYFVSFEISGGQDPYSINGNVHPGGVFNSVPITSDSSFSFLVTDASGCTAMVTGQVLCSCTSASGTMDVTPVDACVGVEAAASYNNDGLLDGNDKLAFILHDGNIPDGIIAWSLTPSFGFMPPMQTETTYYISAVIGDIGAGGLPQLSDPCATVSQGTPIRFHDIPMLTLSNDTILCEGSCAPLIQSANGIGELDITYQVSGESFTASELPGLISIPVCPDTNSVYTVTSISDAYCSASIFETVEFTIRENVTAGIPLNTEICIGDIEVINLNSLLMNSDPGGVWTEISSTLSSPGAFDPLAAIFSASLEQAGTYSFDYTLAGLDGCPGSSAIVDVVIHPKPVAVAGEDKLLACDPAVVSLDASGSSSGSEFQFKWSTLDGLIQGISNTFEITAADGGLYVLTVTNSLTGCTSSDSVRVIGSSINIGNLQIDATSPLCAGDCNGIISVNNASEYFFDFGDGNFTSNPVLNTACSGLYNISLMDSLGCTWDTLITIESPDPVAVNLGPDTIIAFGDSITLSAESFSNIVEYNWFGASSCTNCQQITISPTENMIFTVEVTNENQCQATDQIMVGVQFSSQIFIPDIFTPNGDQVNDLFMIDVSHSLEHIPSLSIFDRWGNKVFERKDITPGDVNAAWDGSYKGSPANPGVYTYLLEATFKTGKTFIFASDITLIR